MNKQDDTLLNMQADFNRRLRRLLAQRIMGSDRQILTFDSSHADIARFASVSSWSDFVNYKDIFRLLNDLGYEVDSGFAYTCDTGRDTVTLPVESVRYLLLKAGEEHAEYFTRVLSDILEDFESQE